MHPGLLESLALADEVSVGNTDTAAQSAKLTDEAHRVVRVGEPTVDKAFNNTERLKIAEFSGQKTVRRRSVVDVFIFIFILPFGCLGGA